MSGFFTPNLPITIGTSSEGALETPKSPKGDFETSSPLGVRGRGFRGKIKLMRHYYIPINE